ncbi:hypothetical protein PFLG_00650 [Plasmodium falciparum RAJ116]|uniref:Uncharacterized protein n=1 Tax=Plasmodium falciparum RAJ116 TaxID=580058 RepID=A0A0L0CU81_PLAFA|nr:hypothetical protein PFLG_00650 [Plasmodium falciparum RAJ116]
MNQYIDNDISVSNKEELIYYIKILNHLGSYDGKNIYEYYLFLIKYDILFIVSYILLTIETVTLIKSVNVENYNFNYTESLSVKIPNALLAYTWVICQRYFPKMLELLVSWTVLHKDMNKDINYSIELAAEAFRNAIQNMHLLENDDECSKTIRILGILRDNINKCGRKNVNALFEINGENLDKYKDIMNSTHT